MDVFHAQTVEDMFYIDTDRDVLTIECNICSDGDYVFSEGNNTTQYGWFLRGVDHFRKYHPEKGAV